MNQSLQHVYFLFIKLGMLFKEIFLCASFGFTKASLENSNIEKSELSAFASEPRWFCVDLVLY